MATNLGTAVGYLTLDITGFSRGIDQATREMERMGTSSESMLDKMGTGFTKAGTALTATVTAPIVGFGASILREGTSFEEAMTQVKNVANLANSDIDEFRQAVASLGFQMTETGDDVESMYKTMYNYAINQGSETRYTAEEVAQALYYMGLAGWEAQDMMYGLRPVLDLAAATGEDLARVSDIVTDSMTALQVPVEDLASYTNVLAEMTRNSNTTLDQAGEAFKYVAPMAGALDYRYQDLAAAVGLFANVGVKGSQAGTGLRQALNSLTNPSEKAKEVLDRLNWSIYNSYGNAKPLITVMKELRDMFHETGSMDGESETFNEFLDYLLENDLADTFDAGSIRENTEMLSEWAAYTKHDSEEILTEYQKMADVIKLVGIRALPGVLGIINASEEDFNSLVESMRNADEAYGGMGASAGMAAELMDTTQGSIYKLTSSISELRIQLFELLGGPFKELVDNLTSVVKWFNSLDKSTQETFVHIAEAAMLIGPTLLVLGKVAPLISGIGTAVSGLKGMLGTAGLASIFSNMSPIDEFGNAVELIGDDFVEAGLKKDGFADNVTGTLNPALGQGTTAAGKFAGAGGLGGILKMLGGIAAVVGGAVLAIASFVDAWQKGWDVLHAILIGLGLALAAVGAVLLGAPAAVAAIVAAVIFVIANGILLVKDHWTEIVDWWNNTVLPGLREFGDAIVACFKKIRDDIIEIIMAFVEFFGTILDDITWFVFEFIPDVLSEILVGVTNFYLGIYDKCHEFGMKIGTAIREWLINTYNNIKEKLSEIVSTLTEKLSNMWNSISTWFTNLINNVTQWFDNVYNTIVQWFETLISNVTNWFENIWNNINQWFENLISNVTRWFSDIMGRISTLVENVTNLISEAGERIMSGISMVFDTIRSGIELLSNKFMEIFNWLMDNVSNALSSIAGAITEFVSGIVSTVSQTISTIMDFIGGLAAFIGSELMNILSAMQGFFESFIAELASTLDGIGTWIAGVISSLSEFVTELWQNLADMTKTLGEGISSLVEAISTGIVEMIEGIGQGLTTMVGNIKSGLTSFLEEIKQSIANGISNLVSAISTGFQNIWSQIFDIGRNIIMGIWDGIQAGASWVADNVGTACNNIISGIRNAFQIGSPSKVMAEEVGRWLPPGIVEGFEDAIPKAEKDINKSLDELIDGVNADDSALTIGTSYDTLQTVMADSYSQFADSVQTTEERLNASLDSMYEKMYSLVLLEQQLNSGVITNTGYGTSTTMNGTTGGMNTTNNNTGNTFIFNSPKPIDEIEAARQMEKTQREMEEGFI